MSEAPSSSSGMAPLLAGLALLLAGGHLAYAMTRGAEDPAPPEPVASTPAAGGGAAPGDCRCDDAALRSEIVDLRRAIRALEARQEARTTAPAAGSPQTPPGTEAPVAPVRVRPPPTESELAMATPGTSRLPPIDTFLDIPSGVKLEQQADGTIDATATDPEVAGQEFVIVGLTKEGEAKLIKVQAR